MGDEPRSAVALLEEVHVANAEDLITAGSVGQLLAVVGNGVRLESGRATEDLDHPIAHEVLGIEAG